MQMRSFFKKKPTVIIFAVSVSLAALTGSLYFYNSQQESALEIDNDQAYDDQKLLVNNTATETYPIDTKKENTAIDTDTSEPPVEPEPKIDDEPKEDTRQENPFGPGRAAWHVFERRLDVGKTLPDGTFIHSHYCSSLDDNRFTEKPTLHAAACFTTSNARGHMGFVEKINQDGSIWVSEMNSSGQKSMDDETPTGGFNRVSYQIIPLEMFHVIKFIP